MEEWGTVSTIVDLYLPLAEYRMRHQGTASYCFMFLWEIINNVPAIPLINWQLMPMHSSRPIFVCIHSVNNKF